MIHEIFSCKSNIDIQISDTKNKYTLRLPNDSKSFEKLKGVRYFNELHDSDFKVFIEIDYDRFVNANRFKKLFQNIYDYNLNQYAENVTKNCLIESTKINKYGDLVSLENGLTNYLLADAQTIGDNSKLISKNDYGVKKLTTGLASENKKFKLLGGIIIDHDDRIINMFKTDTSILHAKGKKINFSCANRTQLSKINDINGKNRLLIYNYDLKKVEENIKENSESTPKNVWIFMNSLDEVKKNFESIIKILFWNKNGHILFNEKINIPILVKSKINIIKNAITIDRFFYKLNSQEKMIQKYIGSNFSKTEFDLFVDNEITKIFWNQMRSYETGIIATKLKTCDICCNEMTLDYFTTNSCGHTYCVGCLSKQLQMKKPCYLCRTQIIGSKSLIKQEASKITFLCNIFEKVVGKKTLIYCVADMLLPMYTALSKKYKKIKFNIYDNNETSEYDNLTTDALLIDVKYVNDVCKIKNIDTVVVTTLKCDFIIKRESLGYDFLNKLTQLKLYLMEYE